VSTPVYTPEPVVTPAPKAVDVDNAAAGKIISTSTYTKDGIVYEVAIEEVAVTVTVTDDGVYKKRHRRHADAHLKRHAGFGRR
jgi:hypothetical protein